MTDATPHGGVCFLQGTVTVAPFSRRKDFGKNAIFHLTKQEKCDIMARYRGVAQVVARQFRVLEAASSSPATSTKKSNRHPPVALFALSGSVKNSPLRQRRGGEFGCPARRSASSLARRRARAISPQANVPRNLCGRYFVALALSPSHLR